MPPSLQTLYLGQFFDPASDGAGWSLICYRKKESCFGTSGSALQQLYRPEEIEERRRKLGLALFSPLAPLHSVSGARNGSYLFRR